MKPRKINVWLMLLFSLMLFAGVFLGYQLQSSIHEPSDVKNKNTVNEVLKLVEAKYVEKVNLDTLNGIATHAMLNKLHLPTIYNPSSKMDSLATDPNSNFNGSGIDFLMTCDSAKSLLPTTKAGLQNLNRD